MDKSNYRNRDRAGLQKPSSRRRGQKRKKMEKRKKEKKEKKVNKKNNENLT